MTRKIKNNVILARVVNREQKRHIRKNHTKFLKAPWMAGCPRDTRPVSRQNCPLNSVRFSIVNNRKCLGHRPVDPCLSRRVSQGHPAGVPGFFLSLCAFFFPELRAHLRINLTFISAVLVTKNTVTFVRHF